MQTRSLLNRGLPVIIIAFLFLGTSASVGVTHATTWLTMNKQDCTASISAKNMVSYQTKGPSISIQKSNLATRPLNHRYGELIFDQHHIYPILVAYTSDITIGYVCQDDFWNVSQDIGGVEWFGLDYAWYGSGPGDPTGQLFEVIFKDTDGVTVADFTGVEPVIIDTNITYDGWGTLWDYQYTLPTSVTLSDGWVEIYSYYAPDLGNLLWVCGPFGNDNGEQNGVSIEDNFAFNLYGPEVFYDHDVEIIKIVQPSTGNAATITPEALAKNVGNNSEYSVPISMEIAKKQYTNYLFEDFEGTFPPAGWTVQTIMGAPWQRNDYWNRLNQAGQGYCADADVDASAQYPMLTSLITPPIDLSTATGIALDFDSFEYVYYNDFTKVDITTDGGVNWVNLWQIVNTYKYGVYEHVNVDLSDYAGYSAVQLRFAYWAPYWDYYWEVDNVRISTYEWITEYGPIVQYYDMPWNTTIDVTFPAWTPADLGLVENTDVEYMATAQTMLATDMNTANDMKTKLFTLHYGFFNDVAVTAINSPVSGPAGPQTPEVTIRNNGQMDESVSVNMVISKIQYGAQWTTDGTAAWSQSFTNYAGGVSPEAMLYYGYIQNDYAYLQSAAIDTSAEPSLSLTFRSMINNYAGGYNCKVLIRATDADPWSDVTPWTNPIQYSFNAAQYTLDVTAYKGTATSVMFEFSGYYYNLNYWYIDDFGLGTYYTDFSGQFPPRAATFLSEYDNTTTIDIAAGQSMNVTLPEWIPADLPFGSIDYRIDASATMNVSDEYPTDNALVKIITLIYEHDVGFTSITEPPVQASRDQIIFSQRPYLPEESWTFRTSSALTTPEYLCYDNFFELTDPIGDVEWYGICAKYDGGWIQGDPTGMGFRIVFYEDDAGVPGDVVADYPDLFLTPVDTGLSYSSFEMYFWHADLWSYVDLTTGWVSIQNTYHPDGFWFLWAGSPEGDQSMYQQGASQPHIVGDSAFNLSRGFVPHIYLEPGTYPVAGIMKNFGPTYTESDIPVEARITHIENSTVIYDEQLVFPGPLTPGSTTLVTFPNVTFLSLPSWEGKYKLELWTKLAEDAHPSNDKKTLTIYLEIPPSHDIFTYCYLTGVGGKNNWFVSPVEITLYAVEYGPPLPNTVNSDGPRLPHGINHTFYSFDDVNWFEYVGVPLQVNQDGVYTIYYYSMDKCIPPCIEQVKHTDFKIDATAPSVTINVSKTGIEEWTFRMDASDETSGLDHVEFYLDDSFQWNITLPGQHVWSYAWTMNLNGNHTAFILAYDAAGNAKESNTVTSLTVSTSVFESVLPSYLETNKYRVNLKYSENGGN